MVYVKHQVSDWLVSTQQMEVSCLQRAPFLVTPELPKGTGGSLATLSSDGVE